MSAQPVLPTQQNAEAIKTWLIASLSERLGIPPNDVDVDEPLASSGLSSMEATVLTGELADWLQIRLSPTLIWEYPTIAHLVRYLAGSPQDAESDGSAAANRGAEKEQIAIVGLGCRLPGAESPEAFWRLLRNGVDAITRTPTDRWSGNSVHNANPTPQSAQWGGFLERVDEFHPQFFHISPREASRIDPQHRLLLEVAWEALENAGLAPDKLSGTPTGVFVGVSTNDYARLQFENRDDLDAYTSTGSAASIGANRLSYLLDLKGPSLTVDTACSSSLVAVHLACQSLRLGECKTALAGGVNLILSPELTLAFSQARMLSPDGRCKTFDAAANGHVRGEGCGIVVLKRLSDALKEGDSILAIVRGSAVNQDGRSNGLTAPYGPAQQAVIRQALENAAIAPDRISYIETHGTGTPLAVRGRSR